MKPIHFLLPLAMLLSYGCSAKTSGTNSSNHEVRLGDWHSILVNGSYDLTIKHKPDSAGYVRIYAPKEIFDKIDFSLHDRTLVISTKKRAKHYGSIKAVAYTDGNLSSVTLNGSGDILLPALNISGPLNLIVSGSGDIESKSLKATDINAVVNGSGDIEISKAEAAGSISLAVNGSGDIEVKNIKAGTVNASTNGSGDIKVSGTTTAANLSIYGSGDIDAARLKTQSLSAVSSGSGGITYGDARRVNIHGKNVRQSKKIKN